MIVTKQIYVLFRNVILNKEELCEDLTFDPEVIFDMLSGEIDEWVVHYIGEQNTYLISKLGKFCLANLSDQHDHDTIKTVKFMDKYWSTK